MKKAILLASFLSLFAVSNAVAADDICNKIAVVDVQKIVNGSLAAKNIRDQLEQKSAEYKTEIDKKEAELNTKNQELSKQQSALSKEVFEEKVREFNNQVADVQREVQMKKSALDQASMEALEQIQKEVDAIIAKLSDEKKFCMAIPSSQILYSKPSQDISDEVLKRLNDKLKKVQVNVPGSSAPAKPSKK